jgi:hypothetical protein
MSNPRLEAYKAWINSQYPYRTGITDEQYARELHVIDDIGLSEFCSLYPKGEQ